MASHTICLQDRLGSQQNIIPFNLLLNFSIALAHQQQLLAMASIFTTHWFSWSTIRCFATSATPHPRPGSGFGAAVLFCPICCWLILFCYWTQTTVQQDPSHPFVAVYDCETQRNPLLLFFSLILVCHWRHWSFAGVPIASCAPMQQWKMWCSFHQNTAWYVSATPKSKHWNSPHSPLCVSMEQCLFTDYWAYL